MIRHLTLAAVTVAAVAAGGAAVVAMPKEQSLGGYSTSVVPRSVSQRHNARLALNRLVGATIAPGATFSFNRRVGTFSQDAGYRKAPVSYNGTLIDDWGGGVCQTSTTLYNAALIAGLEVVERHRHRFAPGYVPPGRDAAVAYYNIDLKLKNPYPFPVRIEGGLHQGRLTVNLVGAGRPIQPRIVAEMNDIRRPVTFTFPSPDGRGRVRNTGKAGCDVTIYRIWPDGRRETVSQDSYPVMARVVTTG